MVLTKPYYNLTPNLISWPQPISYVSILFDLVATPFSTTFLFLFIYLLDSFWNLAPKNFAVYD